MEPQLLDALKRQYANMLRIDLAKLDDIYSSDVVFRDPVHSLRGLPALQDYLAATIAHVAECRFEFLDQLCSADSAYLKWNMHFRHPRLAGGELLTVRGMSQLQFNDRVFFHEDSYDIGGMLYEHVPLIGGVNRWLKARMAG